MAHSGAPEGGAEEMMRAHKESNLWAYFANIALGLWLMAAPPTLGYGGEQATNDLITGALIVVLGIVALFGRFDFWGRWGICVLGIWLLFAPLVFATPSAAAYANDTLAGGLVIAFSVLVPMMPGKAHHEAMMLPGPEVPPGWTYNPSSWWQRAPVIALALGSFLIARYLAAYQLGHIDSAWDPFFGDGTEAVLTSDVSEAWPISDAGLGSLAYLLEALSAFMGSTRRWREMPWMVLMFGVLVVPLGTVSIILVILQPVMVGEWCTLCLVTAAAMLVMIPLAIDEVAAMLQFMRQARDEGRPLWRTFWAGGTLAGYAGGGEDRRSAGWGAPLRRTLPQTWWGVSLHAPLLLSAALGLWLMAAPDVLDAGSTAADSDRILGALVVVVAVIALAEVVRPLRMLNIGLGLLLVLSPLLLPGDSTASLLNDVIAGAAVVLLSRTRGPIREEYGLLQRYIA